MSDNISNILRTYDNCLFFIERSFDSKIVLYEGIRERNQLKYVDIILTDSKGPESRTNLGTEALNLCFGVKIEKVNRLYKLNIKALPSKDIFVHLKKSDPNKPNSKPKCIAKTYINNQYATLLKILVEINHYTFTVTSVSLFGRYEKKLIEEKLKHTEIEHLNAQFEQLLPGLSSFLPGFLKNTAIY